MCVCVPRAHARTFEHTQAHTSTRGHPRSSTIHASIHDATRNTPFKGANATAGRQRGFEPVLTSAMEFMSTSLHTRPHCPQSTMVSTLIKATEHPISSSRNIFARIMFNQHTRPPHSTHVHTQAHTSTHEHARRNKYTSLALRLHNTRPRRTHTHDTPC